MVQAICWPLKEQEPFDRSVTVSTNGALQTEPKQYISKMYIRRHIGLRNSTLWLLSAETVYPFSPGVWDEAIS